ncbi:uncharacterized protein LOC133890178 [Phragmites australis]|uniref:uncharacterized protein LOC133890178 n=1 Tax=Phragmites australis TaxID=29695 RepID=UPI002D77A136|nr:uncharacterized protein LOC133890178 [Phragmites australis]
MQVARKKTAKEVWDYLKTRFVGADRIKNTQLLTLKSDFNTMRMQEGESLDQYAGRLNSMSVRNEQFYDLNKMSFEEVVGRLKVFEEHTRPHASGGNSIGDSQLLFTQAEWQGGCGRDRGRGRGGRSGMSRNDEESDSDGGRRNKSHIKCFNFHMMGHYANECKATKKNEEETHLTRANDTEPALLLVVSEEPV